jgi:hypothetical protein
VQCRVITWAREHDGSYRESDERALVSTYSQAVGQGTFSRKWLPQLDATYLAISDCQVAGRIEAMS